MPATLNDIQTFGVFQKYFGSWARAKMMAGLDQLLAEVKSNKVEVTNA